MTAGTRRGPRRAHLTHGLAGQLAEKNPDAARIANRRKRAAERRRREAERAALARRNAEAMHAVHAAALLDVLPPETYDAVEEAGAFSRVVLGADGYRLAGVAP